MLKVVPLGGMGRVTQNMFVYEYDDELLIVDCGIGFPDTHMPGVDVLIPDYRYVLSKIEQGKKIVGLVFSHGHDDHIAAAPYVLANLMGDFPLYGSPLTARFAQKRMEDAGINREVRMVMDSTPFQLGKYFSVQLFNMTHSVPDTRHVMITTPEGKIYHGSDFKLDKQPVDGVFPDYEGIKQAASAGVLCMMIDCLRIENAQWSASESTVGTALLEIMQATKGKCVVTLMSSHIHRIQQVIDAAAKLNKRIAFVGRSVEQNVDIALELEKLHMPMGMRVDKKEISEVPENELCVVVAGSQGQEGSSLVRAVFGEHPILRISPTDTVIFSADAIPGNELAFYGAIDELCRNHIHVMYPAVRPDIHRSGHASLPEQQELLKLVNPQYVMPIGGTDRHRFKFWEMGAAPLGYSPDRVLIPAEGEVLGFEHGAARAVELISLQPQAVDGLGVGDVGPVVLSDRIMLGQAGIVVVTIPKKGNKYLLDRTSVVTRGFVFVRQASEVVEYIKETTASIISNESRQRGKQAKDDELERLVEKKLSRKLYQLIKREPLIVAEIIQTP